MNRKEITESRAYQISKAALEHASSLKNIIEAFEAGAEWADANSINPWKPADGEDLPEYDREVIVLTQPYPLEGSEYAVSFAHRPNPNGWDGKSVTTGKVEHYTPKTYDKGGWSIPNVVWWLDCDFPKKKKI